MLADTMNLMKHPLIPTLALAGLCCLGHPALAQTGDPVLPSAFTDITAADLDAAAFTQWDDGKESTPGKEDQGVESLVWTGQGSKEAKSVGFGGSKVAGERHLRIGFTRVIHPGTIIARGGGQLSYLKAGAEYPGDLADNSAWLPAERLVQGVPSQAEVRADDYGVWTLPPRTSTRALRFTHTAEDTDRSYAGELVGIYITRERLVNLAPVGFAATRQNTRRATLLVNEVNEGWNAWDNVPFNTEPGPVISEDNAEWIILTWPMPVKVNGLIFFWPGFVGGEIQAYAGAPAKHPREAAEGDWKTVQRFTGLKDGYGIPMSPNRLDFPQTVTTRALRVRVTTPGASKNAHLTKKYHEGGRAWLGELMVLHDLETRPLQAVAFPETGGAKQPPIPVRFTLKEPGIVTLVIEDKAGKRVRNLVSETPYPAGENVVWWDGTNDLGRDTVAARAGQYKIPEQFVEPGDYVVRGLVRGEITPRYEFSVYNRGNPPWLTADGTGGWLTNHSGPQAAAFVPAGKGPGGDALVYLGSYVAEGGSGLAWVDLDGHKKGGLGSIGGAWTGGPYLAYDAGTRAVSGTYLYVASVWSIAKGADTLELRLTALSAEGQKPVIKHTFERGEIKEPRDNIAGLAAYDGTVAVNLPGLKEVLFIEAATGQIQGRSSLENGRGLAYDPQGRLLALTENALVRIPAGGGAAETLVTGLTDPQHVALDRQGNFYISVHGQEQNVRVYSPQGKFLRAIGKPGESVAGPYDPLHMNQPAGLAIDSRDQLWVTESDLLPKRVSVWSLEGKLLRAYYGPSKYGGGGALDPKDKNRFYYADSGRGTLEFSLDWKTREWKLENILYRRKPGMMEMPFRAAAPEAAIYHEGRRYFTNCYNSSPTGGLGTAFVFLEKDGIARPVAAMGSANDWELLKTEAFAPHWPAEVEMKAGSRKPKKDKDRVFFTWSDLNNDANAQPEEVKWEAGSSAGGMTVMDDLSFCASRLQGNSVRFTPTGFTPEGVPLYDLATRQVLARDVKLPGSSGGDQVLSLPDGQAVVTLGAGGYDALSLSGMRNGEPVWSYPSLWPGLHASHHAPVPTRPGQVIGSTRLLGGFVRPKGSQVAPLWAVNGNMGQVYLFTADGLFVSSVFKDARQGKTWAMPKEVPDMDLREITLHQENFWPTITDTPEGQVYIVNGRSGSPVRLDGLDTLRPLAPTPLKISGQELAAAQAYLLAREASRQDRQGSGAAIVATNLDKLEVDGNLKDWNGAEWVEIEATKNTKVTASLALAKDRLYIAYRTGSKDLLRNTGAEATAPFKTGGALDLMLGANAAADPARQKPVPGDLRLLVTQVEGKPRAVLYRAVVPGTKEPVPFSSPWRTITLDRVDDVSAQVELAAGKDGDFEVSIPLGVLGWQPQKGRAFQGDLGILRGDGTQTTARVYWNNKATGLTADVPAEAMLTPHLWGKLEVR
jgi:hypothetical protein